MDDDAFLATLEQNLGRTLRRLKPGPKGKRNPETDFGRTAPDRRRRRSYGTPDPEAIGSGVPGIRPEVAWSALARVAISVIGWTRPSTSLRDAFSFVAITGRSR